MGVLLDVTNGAATADLTIEQGSDVTMYFRVEDAVGTLLDLTGWTGTLRVANLAGVLQEEFSTANGRMVLGFVPPKWLATHAYLVGDTVIPTTPNGYVYQVTVAGTSGGTEPAWLTTVGATFTSGGVTFKVLSPDVASYWNMSVRFGKSVTNALVDWGDGEHQLTLTDAFGSTRRYLEGRATLSKVV